VFAKRIDPSLNLSDDSVTEICKSVANFEDDENKTNEENEKSADTAIGNISQSMVTDYILDEILGESN
jgi:hypothetical protein